MQPGRLQLIEPSVVRGPSVVRSNAVVLPRDYSTTDYGLLTTD